MAAVGAEDRLDGGHQTVDIETGLHTFSFGSFGLRLQP